MITKEEIDEYFLTNDENPVYGAYIAHMPWDVRPCSFIWIRFEKLVWWYPESLFFRDANQWEPGDPPIDPCNFPIVCKYDKVNRHTLDKTKVYEKVGTREIHEALSKYPQQGKFIRALKRRIKEARRVQ